MHRGRDQTVRGSEWEQGKVARMRAEAGVPQEGLRDNVLPLRGRRLYAAELRLCYVLFEASAS
jgi:hypothetical protein